MRIILEKELSDEKIIEIHEEIEEFTKLLVKHLRTMRASSPLIAQSALLQIGCFSIFQTCEDNNRLDLAVPTICAQAASFLEMYKELKVKDEK